MCFFLIFRSLGCQNTGSHPAGKAQKKRNVPKIIVKKNFISKMCKNGYLVGLNNDFGQPGLASPPNRKHKSGPVFGKITIENPYFIASPAFLLQLYGCHPGLLPGFGKDIPPALIYPHDRPSRSIQWIRIGCLPLLWPG